MTWFTWRDWRIGDRVRVRDRRGLITAITPNRSHFWLTRKIGPRTIAVMWRDGVTSQVPEYLVTDDPQEASR